MRSILPRFALLAILAAFVARPAVAQTCTTAWAIASDGNWSDGANWTAGVPAAGDDACITLDGTYTVNLNVNAAVNRLTLGGANGTQTLIMARQLTIGTAGTISSNGHLDWRSNYVRGTATLTNHGTVVMTTNSSKGVRDADARFVNEGTVRYDGHGFHLWDGATFENRSLFDVQADGSVEPFGGGPNTFINTAAGTFRKSGGTGTSHVSVLFENAGQVDAQTGTLRFNTHTEHTDATLAVASGATLRFHGGTHTFSGTLTSEPEGSVVMASPWKAGTDGVMLDIRGTGLQWHSEYLRAGGAVTNRGIVIMTTNSSKGVRDADSRFVNEGTVLYDGHGFHLWDGATFENLSLFDVLADGSVEPFGDGPNTFINTAEGTFRKSGGIGTSHVSVLLENAGHVDAQTGTLQFNTHTEHTNVTLAAASGSTLRFNGGKHTFTGTIASEP